MIEIGAIEETRESILNEIAAVYQIPVRMLSGPSCRTFVDPVDLHDLHHFYVLHNATLKGVKRRARRFRAHFSKMIHKQGKRQ